MSITLYTIGSTMRKAVVDSATSEATGYPKENFADHNPDTYWKPTSTADQTIDIDMNTTFSNGIYAAGYLLNNYLTDHSNLAQAYFYVYHSDDDSSYSSDLTNNQAPLPAGGSLVNVCDLNSGSPFTAKRYFRFLFTTLNTTLQISGLYLFRKYTISQSHELPDRESVQYANRVDYSPSGRSYSTLYNSQSITKRPRTFQLGSGDWANLEAAFNASFGNTYPLVLYDGSTYSWVKFADDELNQNEFANAFYKPTVTFIDEPYIPDGETY